MFVAIEICSCDTSPSCISLWPIWMVPGGGNKLKCCSCWLLLAFMLYSSLLFWCFSTAYYYIHEAENDSNFFEIIQLLWLSCFSAAYYYIQIELNVSNFLKGFLVSVVFSYAYIIFTKLKMIPTFSTFFISFCSLVFVRILLYSVPDEMIPNS